MEKNKEYDQPPMRDPFAEMAVRKKMSPGDIEKYNAIQKKTGGVPIDPLCSEDVTRAVEAIVRAIKDGHREKDIAWINGMASHIMREDGPYAGLMDEERGRVVKLVVEHFR